MEPQKICMSYICSSFMVGKKTSSRYFSYQMVMFNNPHPSSLETLPLTTRCGTNGTSLLFPKRVSSSSTFGKPGGNTMGIQLGSWWPGGLSHPLEKMICASFSLDHFPKFPGESFFKKKLWRETAPLKGFNSCSPGKKKNDIGPFKRKGIHLPVPKYLVGDLLVWLAWHFWGRFPHEKSRSFIHESFPSFFRGQAENEHFHVK